MLTWHWTAWQYSTHLVCTSTHNACCFEIFLLSTDAVIYAGETAVTIPLLLQHDIVAFTLHHYVCTASCYQLIDSFFPVFYCCNWCHCSTVCCLFWSLFLSIVVCTKTEDSWLIVAFEIMSYCLLTMLPMWGNSWLLQCHQPLYVGCSRSVDGSYGELNVHGSAHNKIVKKSNYRLM